MSRAGIFIRWENRDENRLISKLAVYSCLCFPSGRIAALNHIRKPLHGFCKICNRLIRVAVFDPIADTVIDMSL